MPTRNLPKALLFDLGDVLCTWSPKTTTIPLKLMKQFLDSDVWIEFDCGRISQDDCYRQLAQHFSVSAADVAEAFRQARDSLKPNVLMVSLIRSLKENFRGTLNVYAMSNISIEDYAVLSAKMVYWLMDIFDRTFTSGHAGMRKPDLAFYNYVLGEIKMNPEEVIFIDDKMVNVAAAQSLGIQSIVFEDNTRVIHALSNIYGDHIRKVSRGQQHLYENVNRFDSITDSGIIVPDNFAKLLILDTTQDRELVHLEWTSDSKRTWNFFTATPVLIPGGYFPDDLDTTSLALTVLRPSSEVVTSLLDRMLEYVNLDGTIQVYFDRNKLRTDVVVSANVLACFYIFGRGSELESTLYMIRDVLLHRTYSKGTRYYPSPDCCLFFFGRLLNSSKDVHLQKTLGPLLKERTRERIGQDGNALDLAMRILTCKLLHLDCGSDRRALLDMQCKDGGWETGWIYTYGSTGVKLGNRGVTTAMAIKALTASEGIQEV